MERDGDPSDSNPTEPSQQAATPTSARAVGSGSGLRHAGPGDGWKNLSRISDQNLKFADNFQVFKFIQNLGIYDGI